jgi:hypothetical protein
MPTYKDIYEHIQAQRIQKEQNPKYQFTSIKINVPANEFDAMRKAISSKLGRRYQAGIIDIIFELQQVPIIQIIPEKEAILVE